MSGMTAAARSGRRGAVLAAICVAVAVLAGCTSGPTVSAPAPSATTVAPRTSATQPGPSASPSNSPSNGPSAARSSVGPPYIARVQWVKASGGRSLHIVPTAAGRSTHGPADDDEAWSEVVRLAPNADQPGMRAQFDCHWTFARLVQPDKPSWNIEPWRPVVTESQMVDARCNPGGAESAEN
jgi:hypothetical protein